MHRVYFSLGSNIENKQQNINSAILQINNRIGLVVNRSDFIVTEPFGFVSDNLFLNAAICVETDLSVNEVLLTAQQIEKKLGRVIKSVDGIYCDRLIDIDILLYDNLEIDSRELIIPHPRMKERTFVLIPLAQIAPELIIPGETQTIAELLDCIC